MKLEGAAERPPLVLLHGGAGARSGSEAQLEQRRVFLADLCERLYSELLQGKSAIAVVAEGLLQLERSGLFNAGAAGSLQSDAQSRLTAAVMDGSLLRFSGVSQVTAFKEPSRLAVALQARKNRVLSDVGAQLLARELSLSPQVGVSQTQFEEYLKHQHGDEDSDPPTGTVGVVCLDLDGRLSAGTSTGGHGAAYPGRISDVATVAGTYASKFAAISCTGVGEEIVDAAVAARLEARVRDGMDIHQASTRAREEASAANHRYGWIAVDSHFRWTISWTTETIAAACKTSAEQTVHSRI